MTSKELQEEECEVLSSIYDGDANFRQISNTCFQYKIGTDEEPKSFLLEIAWGEDYPNSLPLINLDAFYNKKLISEVKRKIISEISAQADMWLGTAMTYTLFEWAKDNVEELMKSQPDSVITPDDTLSLEEKLILDETVSSSRKEKKPKLSKQQKRKLAEKLDSKGERPRGWNWVDVVKHLSQIGPKTELNDAS